MEGRIYSNVGGGILGIEMPIHQTTQTINHNQTLQKHPQIIMSNNTNNPTPPQDHQQTQLSMNKKPKLIKNNEQMISHSTNNDNQDKPRHNNNEGSLSSFEKIRTNNSSSLVLSPWQRMKWSDTMVRLLIMVVYYYIGDEVVGFDNGNKPNGHNNNNIGISSNNVVGVLQKKGKWKWVSKALMEKGFYVSPQQCEDKFNDLNKRYKRVNDILGRGIACKVVENQSLLDSLDILPKLKEEARKLLNSKHLFFKEMCAYHTSCGHHNNTGPQQISNLQEQGGCHQSPIAPTTTTPQPNSMVVPTNPESDDQDKHSKSHDEDDEEEEEFEDDNNEEEEQAEEEEQERSRKRARTTTMGGTSAISTTLQRLNSEVMRVLQDGTKSSWEKKSWVMTQLIELEEKGVNFKYKEMELEKQRQKWVRFSTKKEREMEKIKVDNLKNRVEIEKMIIFLRKKELVLFSNQHKQRSS